MRPDTQIHTRMCYAEFGDVVGAIDDLDADVISLEAARSPMQVTREPAALLRTGLGAITAERLWANPDCGLKTTRASLEGLVAVARPVRAELTGS